MPEDSKTAFDPDRLLDVDEAADLLQVKRGTLYSWVSKNRVPHRKVGSLVRFHRGELLQWTVEQARGAHQAAPVDKRKERRLRVV